MTVEKAIRGWPPVGVLAMLLLGWAVGNGSTSLDDSFLHGARDVVGQNPHWLLIVTDWVLLGPVLAACVAVALYRRQPRVAVVMALCPVVAILLSEAVKRLFERHIGSYLGYPSGHMSTVVAVMGVVVVIAGGRLWAVTVAVVAGLLAMVALVACGYHYFTDTIGSVLLTTALVCIAARLADCVGIRGNSPLGDAEQRTEKQ